MNWIEMMDAKTRKKERREEYIAAHQEEWIAQGLEIRNLRKNLKLTMEEFSEMVGLTPYRLRQLELGRPVRDGDILVRLCRTKLIYEKMRLTYGIAIKEIRAAYELVVQQNEALSRMLGIQSISASWQRFPRSRRVI